MSLDYLRNPVLSTALAALTAVLGGVLLAVLWAFLWATPALAQSDHPVGIAVAPIAVLSIAQDNVDLMPGRPSPVGFAYTTNLEEPRLVVSLDGALPPGVVLRVWIEETGQRGALQTENKNPGSATLLLAGRAATRGVLSLLLEGTLPSAGVSAELTVALDGGPGVPISRGTIRFQGKPDGSL